MSELQVFQNAEFGSVRTTTVNGEVMFVAKDIARSSVTAIREMLSTSTLMMKTRE